MRESSQKFIAFREHLTGNREERIGNRKKVFLANMRCTQYQMVVLMFDTMIDMKNIVYIFHFSQKLLLAINPKFDCSIIGCISMRE